MGLTLDEPFDIAADILHDVAEALRDEETPGELSKKEIWQLVQNAIGNIVRDVAD